ncbi:MAG: Gfo/Idh/MocA family oxidoreductase [Phycisphaerales bacterium]|nr:Gfo/Idh/MocA family oxidoreductase [Phycisphaerales bacterium]
MSQRLRFGILGTGNIARQFAQGLTTCQHSQLAAVGSRQADSAEAFAREHGCFRAYGTYEQVLDDPNVDAVYISLPNSMHCQWTIAALESGKHVLCEKPFALSEIDAQRMFDVAHRTKRRVMEAFMYRCHPLIHAVQEAVHQGKIGRVKMIRTSFCYRTRKIDGNVRFDPELGGGILLDVGCYCVNFTRLFAGQEPDLIVASGHQHASGVDDSAAGMMRFPNGVLSTFTCSMTTQADNTAYILGEEGYIEIPVPWKPPVKKAVFNIAYGAPPKMDKIQGVTRPEPPAQRTFEIDTPCDLYALEADHFAQAIFNHHPFAVTQDDTLGNTRVLMDMYQQIQRQWA